MTQKELYETFMKAAHGNPAGIIKGAAVNSILAVLCFNSSSVDEAIIQWNELSNFVEGELRRRFQAKILPADHHERASLKLNGDL